MAGKKDTTGKLPFHLLSGPALEEIAKVLAYGMESGRYAERNWEEGLSYEDVFQALQRHAWKWQSGHTHDDESGLNHMGHVACLAMFLIHYSKVGGYEDMDNRPKRHKTGISNCGDPSKAKDKPIMLPIHLSGGNAGDTIPPLTNQGQQI